MIETKMDLADLLDMKDLAEARQDRLVKYYLAELKELKNEILWFNKQIDELNKE